LLANCPIEIHLFADSSKEVEILLLNKGIVFERSERRFRFPDHYRNIPLLKLTTPKTEVELIVFALDDLKIPLLDACGEKSPRIESGKLRSLIKS